MFQHTVFACRGLQSLHTLGFTHGEFLNGALLRVSSETDRHGTDVRSPADWGTLGGADWAMPGLVMVDIASVDIGARSARSDWVRPWRVSDPLEES